MSNGNSFSWLSFLLGLAIGLWIAFVVFFVFDHGDDGCGCGAGGVTIIGTTDGNAYVPAGDSNYYCANNDEGGAIVADEGGAVVADEGGAIVMDEGGAIVADEGGAVVADEGGLVPAPGSGAGQLGRNRSFEEFLCDTNDEGGAVVADRSGRIVAVAMPNSYSSDRCLRVNGNAVVINAASQPIQVDEGGAVVADEGGAVVADASASPDADQRLGDGAPVSETDLAYCMVAEPDSAPIVIRPAD